MNGDSEPKALAHWCLCTGGAQGWELCPSRKRCAFSPKGPSAKSSSPFGQWGHVFDLAFFQSTDVMPPCLLSKLRSCPAIPLTHYNLRACGGGERAEPGSRRPAFCLMLHSWPSIGPWAQCLAPNCPCLFICFNRGPSKLFTQQGKSLWKPNKMMQAKVQSSVQRGGVFMMSFHWNCFLSLRWDQ